MAGFLCEERLVNGDWRALERVLARLMDHNGFEDIKIVGIAVSPAYKPFMTIPALKLFG